MNQPFLQDSAARRARILFGIVEARPRLQLTNPDYAIIDAADGDAENDRSEEGETVHIGRIVPVYEKAGSMTPKMQRRLVFEVVSQLPEELADPFPAEMRERLGVPNRRTALVETHFPSPHTPPDRLNAFRTPAQVRVIFEEFFLFQLGMLMRKRSAARASKPRVVRVDDRIRESARRILPYKLTDGQRGALKEIVEDMQRPTPMNRLLQGDVGAGKTIVALLAAVVAIENGLQVAFMAPTEILAEQHFLGLRRLLERSRFRVELMTAEPPACGAAISSRGSPPGYQPVLATHALVKWR